MRSSMRSLIAFAAATTLLTPITTLTSCDSEQKPKEIEPSHESSLIIGTGPITGDHFSAGQAIARIISNDVKTHGILCQAESTAGSVFNINAIMTGTMAFGIAQSDEVYEASEGLGEWEATGPQTDLMAMFSLHAESVALVAADDTGIETIQDLRGKRVNIGELGSGTRENAIHALENASIDYTKDLEAKGLRGAVVDEVLQEGGIDAYFFTAGHPNTSLLAATRGRRKVHLVPITEVDMLLMKYPFYKKASVHKKFYPQTTNANDVETFGVKATFITSAKVPDRVVYTVTKQVFENIEYYRTLHPAYEELTREKMVEHLMAPIHPGAKKYYDEAGLVHATLTK